MALSIGCGGASTRALDAAHCTFDIVCIQIRQFDLGNLPDFITPDLGDTLGLYKGMADSTPVTAAELAARIWESGYDRLKAPVRRVDTPDVPVPYNKAMEEVSSPSESRIAEAIRAVTR